MPNTRVRVRHVSTGYPIAAYRGYVLAFAHAFEIAFATLTTQMCCIFPRADS